MAVLDGMGQDREKTREELRKPVESSWSLGGLAQDVVSALGFRTACAEGPSTTGTWTTCRASQRSRASPAKPFAATQCCRRR